MKKEYKIIELFSPLSLSFLALMIAVAFWLIPDRYYNFYLNERSLFHLDITSISWVILCTLFYWFGISTFTFLKINFRKESEDKYLKNIIGFIPILVGVGIFFSILLIYKLGISAYLNTITAFGSDYNRVIVYNALESLNLGWVPQLLFPFIAYLCYILFYSRIKYKFYILFAVVIYFLTIIPSQTKASLISFLITIAFAYFLNKFQQSKLKFSNFFIILFTSLFLAISLFIFAQSGKQGRDFSNIQGVIKEIMGYGPASYNRLAAILDQQLKIPNSNMGYYTNTWFWDSPGKSGINLALDYMEFDIPQPSFTNWLETFKFVKASGLNDNYIWVTIYGEAFVDYGYWALLWFFLYGFLSQICWKIVKRNNHYIMLYSVFLISGVQWYATASIGNKSLVFSALALLTVRYFNFSYFKFNLLKINSKKE